ncbi:MAG TPA: 1-acyl-sn-glycerol-3-phosphate acyltransferase [Hyphomicrobiales bacterium]|nr:1-acyl-sn-glycerol-3-phosphate acyltransferase [Hyphomicrobiales bacterium]
MQDFDDIRPYHDSEVRGVVDRLVDELALSQAMAKFRNPRLYRWFPGPMARLVQSALKAELKHVRNVRDVQCVIEKYLDKLIERTTDGLTHSGLDQLDPALPYLFISNHRDITMDPALVNYMLYHQGFDTLQIAIGDNLLKRPFLSDLMRLNKSFIVKRSLHGREKLAASKQLSCYIRHCIRHGQNVWIAQREGRAKDGVDKTESAIIKMLHMAGREGEEKLPLQQLINQLNIVPVAISYEFDPCDAAKAQELHAIETVGRYQKDENTDVNSILTGMIGAKGAVHVSFGTRLNVDDAVTPEGVAELIDQQIIRNYRLHLVNYLALERIQHDFMDFSRLPARFGLSEALVQHKRKAFAARLDAIAPQLHPYVLNMYANPVLRQFELQRLNGTPVAAVS